MINTWDWMMRLAGSRRTDWRRKRMQAMLDLMKLPPRSRVIDLGGTEENWRLIDHGFHVTLVNLPDWQDPVSDPDHYRRVDGDACNLGAQFADNSFEAVFSNSTIEHVGDEEQQARFAAETRRLAPAYWVQTPSTLSPIEPHTGVPFYWRLPRFLREAILSYWDRRVPGWVVMLRGTRVLSRRRMRELFPDGRIYVERILGVEKSYTFYRPYKAPGDSSH